MLDTINDRRFAMSSVFIQGLDCQPQPNPMPVAHTSLYLRFTLKTAKYLSQQGFEQNRVVMGGEE